MQSSRSFQDSITPTPEQKKIIEAAISGQDLVIQALAGTGKTTTLKLLAEALPRKKGTYIAFNKSIVEEAGSKFPENVRCRTAHSLAYAAVGFQFKERMNDSKRVTMYQLAAWLDAPKFAFKHDKVNAVLGADQIASLVIKSVTNFCKSVDPEISEKHIEIPFYLGLDKRKVKEFAKILIPLVLKSWDDLNQATGYLKFTHDYYLKMWQLSSPVIKGDFILFDEAQDADPVMLDVIERQKHAQKIFCGDQYQAIYEWRGAKNALNKVSIDETLWLTQSFRFGQEIADEANDILGFLDAPVTVTGLKGKSSKIEKVNNPTAILCRTNAGVIQQVIFELQKGRSVAVIGRTEELINFAEACGQLQKGVRTNHPELAPFETWGEVKEYADKYPDEAQEIKTMVDLVDRFGVQKLVEALRKVVSEATSDVVVSTAHRAKGREWSTVKLAGDFLHPQDMDDEDLRLAYVSVTRAIDSLDMSEWELIQPINTGQNDFGRDNLVAEKSEELSSARSGTKWSLEEDLSLVESAIQGTSIEKIAIKTGRSISALQSRLAKWFVVATFGVESSDLASANFSGDGWDDKKVDLLFELWNEMEMEELASELEVSLFRVATQAIKYDLVEIDEEFRRAVKSFYR